MMFKRLLLSLTLLISSFSSGFVYAQEEPVPVIMSDLGVPYSMECVAVSGVDGGWPPQVDNVTFTGTCSSQTPCNIGICGPTAGGAKKCTVYDPTLDQRYFGEVGTGLPDVKVKSGTPHMFPPGQFTIEGSITNPGDHVWYDIYAVSEPEPMGTGGEGDDPSQQLGTTKFVFPGSKEICRSVFWDPYGRVFDAVSLEPLGANEARVTLLDDKDQYVDVPSNNSPIDNLGKYNIFILQDGLYKLKVANMARHEFVRVEPDPKYVDMYERIYKLGDPAFMEKQSDPERYDIPVKPKGAPYKREIETIYKDQTIIWMEGEEYTKIEFRVSHPLTKIVTNIDGGSMCEQTGADYTDKEGFCTMTIPASLAPETGIEIGKVKNPDYYLSYEQNLIKDFVAGIFSIFASDVSAQQSIRIDVPVAPQPVMASDDITFEPILRHIEGYAYDDSGKQIPKAKVQIVLTMNGKVFYQTTADDSGFFTIYKSNLPPLEYDLKIIDPSTSKTFTQTTSLFIENNQPYIDSEKLNLMAVTKNDQPIVNPATGQLNEIVKTTPAPKQVATQPGKSAIDLKILSVFVILFILVASTIGVALYIKQSRPQA
jgi:hypothetical protein